MEELQKAESVTNTVDVEVGKDSEGNWKVEFDEELLSAIFGGLLEAIADYS